MDDTKNILLGVDKKIAAALLDEEKVTDFYTSLITKLDQAALEIEALIVLGAAKHLDMDHYIDSHLREELHKIMVKANKRKLQFVHGIKKEVDNVSFLEEHPLFRAKKTFDKE